MNYEDLEKSLRALLKGDFSSLTISFNDTNAPNYMSVKEAIRGDSWAQEGWVSEEEKQRAIATNSMWSIQWYPDTPVGFHVMHASSLPALFDALEKEQPHDR